MILNSAILLRQVSTGNETKCRNTALPQGKRVGENHYMFIMYPGKGKPELLVFSLPERKEEMAMSHC